MQKKLHDIKISSQIEQDVIYIIENFAINNKCQLLAMTKDYFYLYHCLIYEIDNHKRFHIYKMDSFAHDLDSILNDERISNDQIEQYNSAFYCDNDTYSYDSAYDGMFPELAVFNQSIQAAVGNISLAENIPIFVKGLYSQVKSLMYCLQNVTNTIVSLIPKHERLSTDGRFYLPDTLGSSLFHVDVAGYDLRTCMNSDNITFAVPLDKVSLDSIFWKEATWHNILPDTETFDYEMSAVKIKLIEIDFEIDGYANVFCIATDMQGKSKISLLHDAFDECLDIFKNESDFKSSIRFVPISKKCKTVLKT